MGLRKENRRQNTQNSHMATKEKGKAEYKNLFPEPVDQALFSTLKIKTKQLYLTKDKKTEVIYSSCLLK